MHCRYLKPLGLLSRLKLQKGCAALTTKFHPQSTTSGPCSPVYLLPSDSHCVTQLQAKAGHKEKRLGWGARLEAAAQAGAGIEVNPMSLLCLTGRSSPQHGCKERTDTMDLTAAAFAHVVDLSAPLDGSMADIHSVCACCIYLWNNSWSP